MTLETREPLHLLKESVPVVDSLKVLDPDGRLEKRSNIGTAAKRRFVP